MMGERATLMNGTASAAVPPASSDTLTFVSEGEDETGLLAQLLVEISQAGDVICLFGQVGAGKSVFSRAFVRAVAGDPELVVPSPTFLLQQVYEDHPGTPVHHFDRYRLNGPTENFQRLGLEESFGTAISLIEWPECLGSNLPEEHLDIHIDMNPPAPAEQVVNLATTAQSAKAKHWADAESVPSEPTTISNRVGGFESRGEQGESAEINFDEDEGDEEAGAEETYCDRRPRRFVLKAHGERWAKRLQDLVSRTES